MRHFTPALSILSLLAACNSTTETVEVEVATSDDAAAAEAPASETDLSPAGDEDDIDAALSEDANTLTLQEQRKVLIVDRHLDNARDLRDRLRLEDAQRELELALGIDPD
ncbi:MAG: hypothetical protein MK291_09295, partial [Planctomycetes bacterium]|nr:hypothetical protein [Planctomycetota bacterium]